MPPPTPAPAKLSRPRLYRVSPRERLFRLLDERLVASQAIASLTADDLRFTREEAAQLLAGGRDAGRGVRLLRLAAALRDDFDRAVSSPDPLERKHARGNQSWN